MLWVEQIERKKQCKRAGQKTSNVDLNKKNVACTKVGHNARMCRHKWIQHVEHEAETHTEDKVTVIIYYDWFQRGTPAYTVGTIGGSNN